MNTSEQRSSAELSEIAEALAAGLPGIKVVKGQPDEAELAALVASIISARAANRASQDDGSNSSIWADPRRRWGVAPTPDRAAWRWSTHQAW